MKFHRDLLIRSTSKLSLKIYFFAIFWVPSWFLRSMGAVPQNWLIPQKFHKKQSCRVSKSKIIMCLWSVALKARKAAKWPRTFYMVWTVIPCCSLSWRTACIWTRLKRSNPSLHIESRPFHPTLPKALSKCCDKNRWETLPHILRRDLTA